MIEALRYRIVVNLKGGVNKVIGFGKKEA